MVLTEKEKRKNRIKSQIRSCLSDIENLESEIFDLREELDDLEN